MEDCEGDSHDLYQVQVCKSGKAQVMRGILHACSKQGAPFEMLVDFKAYFNTSYDA